MEVKKNGLSKPSVLDPNQQAPVCGVPGYFPGLIFLYFDRKKYFVIYEGILYADGKKVYVFV